MRGGRKGDRVGGRESGLQRGPMRARLELWPAPPDLAAQDPMTVIHSPLSLAPPKAPR